MLKAAAFLAFSEIHPDYYQIPREDREALLREEAEHAQDHQRGTDLHGRPLAPDGGAAGQTQQRQQDLADHGPGRQQAPPAFRVAQMPGGDGLRYAAAL